MESIILPTKTITTPKIPQKSKLFPGIAPQNLTNNAYLRRLCKLGRLREAISYLDSCSCSSGVRHSTLSHLIESCIASNSLDLCYEVHSRVKDLLRYPDPFLDTKLLSMYAKCGSLSDAFVVFHEMPERNLYTWSAIVGACSREKRWGDVVELFYRMMEDGDVVPDDFLFPKILQACGKKGDVETGRLIHGMVIKCGMSSRIRVINSVLSVYAKCGWLSSAKRLFEGMEVVDRVSWNVMISGYCNAGKISDAERIFELMRGEGFEPDVITWNALIAQCIQSGKCDVAMKLLSEMESAGIKPDVFTWTSLILGFAQSNRRLEAMKLFKEMLLAGVKPNDVALMSAISVCSALKDIQKGKESHSVAIKLGYGEDLLVGNSLIDMYSKCGKLETAREVFDMLLERDVYTWNSMIGGYYQAGYCSAAHDLFKEMQDSNVSPNVITLNVMITGYMQDGDEDHAMDLFRNMEKKWGVKPDTASWNALIAGYVHLGEKNEAIGIFREMQSVGIKPNSVTILSILPACANLIAFNKVKEIYCCVLRNNIESELSVLNSLIDVFAMSGNIKYSKAIFDRVSSMDTITWNTMVMGFVLHGSSQEALELFEQMRKVDCRPNRSTFASLISAYGLARMVDGGRCIFTSMAEEYQILPFLDHYVAMVNLYGRLGKLDEAFNFIRGMDIEPDVTIWSAFLIACCRHKHVKLAICAAEKILELETNNSVVLRLLPKLYELYGIPKDSLKTKRPVTGKDSKDCVRCSWVEVKNIVHTFVTGDIRQVDSSKPLLSWIKSTELKTKEANYHEMISIDEEETDGVHSEKLALAFALIKSPKTLDPIRIVKNSRMCDHCHRFAKLVSKTNGCKLYISDSVCLHHFVDGMCSCGDYW